MSLSSDERDYNEEVVFSSQLIGGDNGNRLPIYFDLNNPNSSQQPTLNYGDYVTGNTLVSLNYYNPNNENLSCFTGDSLCDIGLTGTDNGLVPEMSGETIYFSMGLYTGNTKWDRYHFDRRTKLIPITAYTTEDITLTLQTEITPGSVIATYNLYANEDLVNDVTINFTNVLGYTGGTISIITGVTITSGNSSGQTIVTINEEFDSLDRTSSITGITSTESGTAYEIQVTPNSTFAPVTPTPSVTQTVTPTITESLTPTPTTTVTPTSESPTPTPTETVTPTTTETPTPTPTPSVTITQTPTSTITPTPTSSPTVAGDSIYNLLSSTGKTAYTAATVGNFIQVSESDYVNVLNNLTGASNYGPTFDQFTGNTNNEWGPVSFISDSTQLGLSANNYIVGFAVRAARFLSGQQFYTVNVYQTTGTVSGGTYTGITNNISFTNPSAGAKNYFIRKSPQTAMNTTTYLGLYSSGNITQLDLSARLQYFMGSPAGTPPFSSLTSRPPAFIVLVASSKTW